MLKIALTGGLCSGKSVVSGCLRTLGCPVIDADALAHTILPEATPALVERFGAAILDAGAIQRARLAALVFASPESGPELAAQAAANRRALNAILHPRIMSTAAAQLSAWEAEGFPAAAVEAALLIEEHLLAGFDRTLLVVAPVEVRIQRFVSRGGTIEQARARMAAQWMDEQKLPWADHVIVNDRDSASVCAQVRTVMAEWLSATK